MASLCSESSRSYSGRSVSVPVSKACLKGGATGETRLVRTEVSRGRSTDFQDQWRREGLKGTSKYVSGLSRDVMFARTRTTARWQTTRGDSLDSLAWGCTTGRLLRTRSQSPSADPLARWCGRGPQQCGPYPDRFVSASINRRLLAHLCPRPFPVCSYRC